MKEIKEKVGPLKKITLSWEAGRTSDYMDLTSGPKLFEFIYSLGPAGLSPFEYALADKTVGEEIRLRIEPSQAARTFQHLPMPGFILPKNPDFRQYRIRILNISSAANREIVAAMAQQSACSDCCGDH